MYSQPRDGYRRPPPTDVLALFDGYFLYEAAKKSKRQADIDLEAAEWRYTLTKANTPHLVPLSRQAVEILKELHPLTGQGHYVFPSARTSERPMSDDAVLSAMRRMNIGKDEMTGHAFPRDGPHDLG